jgi:hypothetical protein
MGQVQFSAVISRAAAALALACFLAANLTLGQDRDVAAEFKTAKTGLTQQLKDKKKETRLAAVAKLETFPTADAAKLLLFQGLGSTHNEVKSAAFDALVKISGEKDVSSFLKTTVSKQWRAGKPQPETYAALAILLASDSADVQDEATELVRDAITQPQHGRTILITLADELAKCRGENAYRALAQLVELPLFKMDFAFRRAVEQALTHVRSKEAVTMLIELLGVVKGEVRADIVHYLSDISGQQMGIEFEAWAAWWREHEKDFEFPPEQKQQPAAGVAAAPKPAAGPSYYGLPLSGAKIIFVIDTSGSMNGPRIFAAKRELSRAVEELPADVEFNIVAFNVRTYAWQAKLLAATPDHKQNAQYFIAAQGLGGGTASYDALEAALQFDAEAIYFLTDGAPVGGKVVSPPEIVRTITRLNQFRRMTINSLGIGVNTPVFDSFLSTLAQQNYGAYERVDQ